MKHKHKSPSFLTSLPLPKITSVPEPTLECVLSTLKMVPPSYALFPFSIEEEKKKKKEKNWNIVVGRAGYSVLLPVQMAWNPDAGAHFCGTTAAVGHRGFLHLFSIHLFLRLLFKDHFPWLFLSCLPELGAPPTS